MLGRRGSVYICNRWSGLASPRDDALVAVRCQNKTKHLHLNVQIRDLNSGTFGFVELALDKSTGQQVAVKFIERGDKVLSCTAPCCAFWIGGADFRMGASFRYSRMNKAFPSVPMDSWRCCCGDSVHKRLVALSSVPAHTL